MALKLPEVRFPKNTPGAIRWFWVTYWIWFLLFLPWMLFRQVFASLGHVACSLATWNRTIRLREGVTLVCLNSFKSFLFCFRNVGMVTIYQDYMSVIFF